MIECYKGQELIKTSIDDILYIESFDDDVFIITENSNKYKIRMRLYEFEQHYQTQGFVRIHKSYIVNILKVKKICPLFNSKLKLVLLNKASLYVSRTYLKSFKKYLINGGGEHIDC